MKQILTEYSAKPSEYTADSFASAMEKGVDAVSFKVSARDEKCNCELRELLELAKGARPSLVFRIELEECTEGAVDLTVELLKEYNALARTYFCAHDAEIIRYLKQKHSVRTVGYPDFEMSRFVRGDYRYYDAIGLSMDVVRSEIFDLYSAKNLPMHMYADNEEDVALCIERGADLISTNDLAMLMKYLDTGE